MLLTWVLGRTSADLVDGLACILLHTSKSPSNREKIAKHTGNRSQFSNAQSNYACVLDPRTSFILTFMRP
jgi:hypothetical protein